MKFFWPCLFLLALFYSCSKSKQEQTSSPDILKPTGLIPSTLAEMQEIPFIEDVDTSLFPSLKKTTGDANWDVPVPPAGDQSITGFGNCAAWAVGYGMLSTEFRKSDEHVDYNGENKIFSPSFIYNQLNEGKDDGISISTALNFLKTNGCCKWSYMSGYIPSFTQQPTTDALQNALRYKIESIKRLHNVDNEVIKRWLVRNYPIPFAVDLDSGFAYGLNPQKYPRFSSSYEKRGVSSSLSVPVWKQKVGGHLDNHALLICGYDDNIRAFKVLNSWGGTWGDGYGHVWIDYDFLKSVVVKNKYDEPEMYLASPKFLSKASYTFNTSASWDCPVCISKITVTFSNISFSCTYDPSGNNTTLSGTSSYTFKAQGHPPYANSANPICVGIPTDESYTSTQSFNFKPNPTDTILGVSNSHGNSSVGLTIYRNSKRPEVIDSAFIFCNYLPKQPSQKKIRVL